MAVILEKGYVGALCEVHTLKNVLLAAGRICRIKGESLEITGDSNDMPIITYNTPVKITVYHAGSKLKVLVGQVYLSNHELLSIVDVINFVDYERRRYFRLDVSVSAYALVPVREGEEATERLPVHIQNLSLCGLLLEGEYPWKQGDGIKLELPFCGLGVLVDGIVRRIQEQESGRLAYGVEFIGLDDKTEQKICAFLFQKQREQLHKVRRKQDF